jgi:molybdate transport system substrate-binding protein
MKKTVLSFLVIATISVGFREQPSQKVTVAVAANMQYAMNALKEQFVKETGMSVDVILGSSGKLTQQIEEGAPYDVFVSADTKYPEELYDKKFATAAPKIYAKGLLVLWTARTDIKPSSKLQLLTGDDIKKIAIANPKTAPYGVAAEQTLKYYELYDKVQSKLVYGANISQTNQFILTLSADVGFTAKSVVLADEMKGRGTWVAIDEKAYEPISQAAVLLTHGRENNKDAAEKFYTFLYSSSAKDIYQKFGYIVTSDQQ